MNKREIISWLEHKKDVALDTNRTHYEEIKRQEAEKILQDTDFSTMANKMQQFLEKAIRIWDAWEHSYGGHPTMKINIGYNNFLRELHSMTKEPDGVSKYLHQFILQFQSGRFDEIWNERREANCKIGESYQKVIDAVLKSRSAKEAMEFVASLGFDLAEIEQDLAPTASRMGRGPVGLVPEKTNKNEGQKAG